MNGPDKHHMQVIETDDGGHVMCSGCRASGNGFNWRPEVECPTPFLDRSQCIQLLRDIETQLDSDDYPSLGYELERRITEALRLGK